MREDNKDKDSGARQQTNKNNGRKRQKWFLKGNGSKIREFTITTPMSYRIMTDPVITTALHSGPIKRKYCQ